MHPFRRGKKPQTPIQETKTWPPTTGKYSATPLASEISPGVTYILLSIYLQSQEIYEKVALEHKSKQNGLGNRIPVGAPIVDSNSEKIMTVS